MKERLLSVGTAYIDINCRNFVFENSLRINTETIGDDYEVSLGGSALNFARICSNLSIPVIFIGKIGNDIMGKTLITLLDKTLITPALIQSDKVSTNVAVHYIRKDGRSIMTSCGTANRSLSPEEIESEVNKHIDNIKYLYLGGCFKLKNLLPFYPKLARRAKNKNVLVVVDHGRLHNKVSQRDIDLIKETIKIADYYLPSRDEFLTLWCANSIKEGLKKVAKKSNTIIVVKNSEKDVVGLNKFGTVVVPTFPVFPINTVGAGDSFNAGFIKGLSLELSFRDAIRFGCATAALKISQEKLPTINQVKKLVLKTVFVKN